MQSGMLRTSGMLELPPTADNRMRMEHAIYMAKVFHELDPVTPVTIGATFAENMIQMGDAVDVLSFDDYSPTRAQIRANIAKAKLYAAKVGKPLVNTEIGCIAGLIRPMSRSRNICRPMLAGTFES